MRILAFLLMFFSYIGLSNAQAADEFCEKAKSSADMVQCLSRTYDSAQAKLKRSYDSMMRYQSVDKARTLAQSQRDWLVYRDSNCMWESSNRENQSIQRVYELSCLIRMTQTRNTVLEQVDLSLADQRRRQGYTPRWMNVLLSGYPDVYWKYGGEEGFDLNCNGWQNFIVTGLRVPTDRDSKSPMYEDYHVIVGIASMPETGKPETRVFDFPVSKIVDMVSQDQKDKSNGTELRVMCSGDPLISVIPAGTVNIDQNKQGAEACQPQAIQLTSPGCESIVFGWDEKEGFRVLPAFQDDVAE